MTLLVRRRVNNLKICLFNCLKRTEGKSKLNDTGVLVIISLWPGQDVI